MNTHSPVPRRFWAALYLSLVSILSSTCHSAVTTGALALGTATARRSSGECYTPCSYGTVCNRDNGTCDAIPCGGTCRKDQMCEQLQGYSDHCVAKSIPNMEIKGNVPMAPLPTVVPRTLPAPKKN